MLHICCADRESCCTADQGYVTLNNTAFTVSSRLLRAGSSTPLFTFNTTADSASACNELCLQNKNKTWQQSDGVVFTVNCTMWRYCLNVRGGCLSDDPSHYNTLDPRACQLQSMTTLDKSRARSPWQELGGKPVHANNSLFGAPFCVCACLATGARERSIIGRSC